MLEGWELRRTYLEGIGAKPSHEKNGLQWILPTCPFCAKAWHLYVSDATGAWICFKCNGLDSEVGKSSRFILLVAAIEGIDEEEAAMVLATGESSIVPGVMAPPAPVPPVPDFIDEPLPTEAEPIFFSDGALNRWPSYLTRRNISRETARRFDLHFCTQGRYRNRIILPIECPRGRSFATRLVHPGEPRYLSGPYANRLFFGWDQAVELLETPWIDQLVLVEGPFDAMSCQQAGLPAVALQGMQLRREQKEMIERAAVGHLLLMLDQTALDNALRLASELGRQRCTIARLPKKDPNACSKEEIIDAALGAISWHDASLLSSREKVSAR